MAFTAREVIMTFRGQNYLSGALRRVGRDVGALSRTQQLTQQRQQLQLVRQRAMLSRQAAQAELSSVQAGGARFLQVQKARETALRRESQLRTQLVGREGQLLSAQQRRLASVTKIAGLQAEIAQQPARLASEREALRAQIQQAETGSRTLALQKAQVATQLRENQELIKTDALTKQIMRNDEATLRLQGRLARLRAIPPTSRKFVGVPQDIAAARAQMSRLQTERQQLLARQVTVGPAAQAMQSAELARLNALEGEQIAKVNALKTAYRDLGPAGAVQLKNLRDQLAQASIAAARLGTQEATLREQVDLARRALQEQGLTIQQVEARETELAVREAQLVQIINTRTDAIAINTAKLEQNAMAMRALPWERFQSGARAVEHTGRVLQMFGLIATATLGFAAGQAAKFQTSITLAATQSTLASNNTTRQVIRNAAVLQRAVQGIIAAGTTATSDELSTGLYTILSGVTLIGNQRQQLQQAVNILGQFNRVLTANYGVVQFNEIVKAGIALINNFGLSAKSLPAVLNRMQASVRFGAMNMAEFTGSLNQVVPAFRGAHYSFDQLAADVAFVSRLFPSLRVGTTGLSRLVETFGRYNKEISQAIGTNIAPRGRLLPVADIVAAIVKARPELRRGGVDLQNFFKVTTGATSTVQARRAFVGYVTQLGLYRKIAKNVINDNNELDKSFTDMSQQPQVRWAEFTQQLRLLVMEIGAGAIPVFQALSRPIQRLVQWFDHLSPSAQKTIGYITTLAAAITLLGGTLLAVVGGFASLLISWRLLQGFRGGGGGFLGFGRSASVATEEIATLGSEAGAITASGALALGAPAAIAALIIFHKQVGTVVNALGGLENVLRLITIGFAAFTLYKTIASLNVLRLAIMADNAALLTMRTLLMSLSAIGAIVITIYEIHKIVKDFLPGLDAPVAEPTLIGPQRLAGAIQTGASTRRGVERTREDIGRYVGQGPEIFKSAEELFGRMHDPDKIFDILRKRYKNASRTFLAQVVVDAGVLMRDAARRVRPTTGQTPTERGAVAGRVRTVQQWIILVERARKAALGSPGDVQKQLTYERAVANLNKQFKDQPQLLAAINDVLQSYDSSTKKAARSTQTLGVTFQDMLSRVQSMYDEFQQQEQGIFGTLFQGPLSQSGAMQNIMQFGGRMTGQDLVSDLRSQLTQFRTFHGALNQLARRGAPPELLKQLTALGPEALKQIQALNQLSPQALRGYFKLFQTSQSIIHQQTMRDLRNQLNQYNRYGKSIALQIIAGLRSEQPALTAALTNLIKQSFPGLPVGRTGAGGRATHTAQRRHTSTATSTTKTEIHHHDHTAIHVHGKTDAEMETKAQHALFRARNKYRH